MIILNKLAITISFAIKTNLLDAMVVNCHQNWCVHAAWMKIQQFFFLIETDSVEFPNEIPLCIASMSARSQAP